MLAHTGYCCSRLPIPNWSDHVVYRTENDGIIIIFVIINVVVPIAVAFTIVITLCLHVSFLFFLMFSSCFYFNHKALLCNITFLMDIHGETLTAWQAVCKSTRNIYSLLTEILNLTFHKTWASHWGKTAVCDLLYMGRNCLRVNYQCYLWSFHFKCIHCSGIWWPNDKNTSFWF